MPFFRKKEKPSSRPPTAPEIPKLELIDDRSLSNLGSGLDDHSNSTSTTSNGTNKHANGHSTSIPPPSKANTTVSQKARIGSMVEANSSLQQSRKYDTVNHLANVKPQDNRHTIGHNPKSGSLARSMSQGAVPYHLPWTRDLVHDDTGGMGSFDQNNNQQQSIPASSSRRKMGPPPSAANNSHGLAALFNRPTDFRVSPNSIPQPTASQRRQVIDTARSQSLRRAKAPAELNLMTFGATGTGKTSFIRTLLATCDLSLCTDEAKRAASFFGISPDYKHSTHDMDPIMPLRTKQYEILQGIDLHPNSLIPISALEAGMDSTGRHSSIRNRPGSMFSTRTSNTSGFGSGRLQLSVCDTPGIDFELEDDFEIERKVNAGLRHLEFKLGKTLSEENKVQRQPRGDGLMHLILYFIDPRFLVDRVHTRKAKILRARYATAQTNKKTDSSQQQKRTRSTSMVGGSTSAQAAFSGNLNKQAQTAQLRQSMEQIQARSSPTKTKHGTKGSVSTIDMPSSSSDAPKESVEEEILDNDDGVEGLSQRELSIISRLSERANVLPIIAKADTLTTAQLEEVRTAVRNSIIKANIDLGAFEVDGVRRKKRIRAREPNPISSVNQRGDLEESTPESSGDTPFNTEPVKVIRIRSRRSYSAHSGERMAASTSGHSMSGNNVFDDPADEGHSNLEHTSPLFDGSQKDGDEQDEEEIKFAPELVSKMIPFSLFVPEPIRVRSKQSQSTRSAINAQKGGAPARKASMNSIAENLPPVPKLPNDIASLRKGLGEGRPGTGSTISQSDLLSKTNGEEEMETLESKVPNTENTSGNDQQGGRQSVESASIHPATNGAAKVSTDGDIPTSTHPSTQAGLSSITPPPPPQSMRFVREYRFGNANVLDGRQCDFNLMRTCVLGSHVEKMRDVTNDRYERFRSQQLELRKQETIKQTSTNAVPPNTTTATATSSSPTTNATAPAGPN